LPGMKLMYLLVLTTWVGIVWSQAPSYYTGPGTKLDDPKSCPTSVCPSCPAAKYNANCVGASPGTCNDCLNSLPLNSVWDPPSFSPQCSWKCQSNFALVSGLCAPLQSYATTVKVALPLDQAQVSSSINSILASFAALAGCGTCPTLSAPPSTGCSAARV